MGKDKVRKGGYTYTLTTHSREDVQAQLAQMNPGAPAEEAPVVYCDSEGVCMFDEQRQPYIQALEALLNQQAGRRRRLVQVLFRPHQMIAVWETRQKED